MSAFLRYVCTQILRRFHIEFYYVRSGSVTGRHVRVTEAETEVETGIEIGTETGTQTETETETETGTEIEIRMYAQRQTYVRT